MAPQQETFASVLDGTSTRVFVTVWPTKKQLTFAEFASAAAWSKEVFESKTLTRGDRVALLSKGTLEFYVAVVGLHAAGLTPVFLNWRQPLAVLATSMADAHCVALAVGERFVAEGRQLSYCVPRLIFLEKKHVLMGAKALAPRVTGVREAGVFFTSGTTRPKAVLHYHEPLLKVARTFPKVESTMCFLPNFHVLMTFQNFLVPLARGFGCAIFAGGAAKSSSPSGGGAPGLPDQQRLLLLQKNDVMMMTPRLLLRAIAELKPSTVDTVPFVLQEWSTLSRSDLAPLAGTIVRCGGAPLSRAVADRLRRNGLHQLRTHYGQTEVPGMPLVSSTDVLTFRAAVVPQGGNIPLELKLDGGGSEGELLFKSTTFRYLKNGAPVSSSSSPWHRTGDVFRRTKEGDLQFVSRADDVILLSTGEMFNPVPFEVELQDRTNRKLAVLGQKQAAPFLVVEGAFDEWDDKVWFLTEQLNRGQPEYGRIRKSHVVFVPEIPTSVKGNVLRREAEALLAEKFAKIEQDAPKVDLQAIQRAAFEAGVDVDAYVRGKDLAIFGVDSLGIVALKNVEVLEAERIGDNVKAWMVTAIVLVHWYRPSWLDIGGPKSAGTLAPFYDATEFTRVSWHVQFAVMTAGFCSSLVGPKPAVLALMFSVGYADGARDGKNTKKKNKGVTFTKREPTILALIVVYKLVIFLVSLQGESSWHPKTIAVHEPRNVAGFFYLFVEYRVVTWLGQQLFQRSYACSAVRSRRNNDDDDDPRRRRTRTFYTLTTTLGGGLGDGGGRREWGGRLPSRVCLIALVIVVPYLWNFRDKQGPWRVGGVMPTWLAVLWNVTLANGAFVLRDGGRYVYEATRTAASIHGIDLKREVSWVNGITTYPAWLLGYWYGKPITQFLKRRRHQIPCLAFVAAAYGLQYLYQVVVQTWVSDGRPSLVAISRRTYPETAPTVPKWIWSSSESESESSESSSSLRSFGPPLARPLYLVGETVVGYAIAFCVVGACAVVRWRASRCGNAALGKFVMMQLWSGFYAYLCWLVSAIHGGGIAAQVLQVVLLVGWPFLFVYLLGPLFTSVAVNAASFVVWLPRQRSPVALYDDIRTFVLDAGPNDFSHFWANYFYELKRDLNLLRGKGGACERNLIQWRRYTTKKFADCCFASGGIGLPGWGEGNTFSSEATDDDDLIEQSLLDVDDDDDDSYGQAPPQDDDGGGGGGVGGGDEDALPDDGGGDEEAPSAASSLSAAAKKRNYGAIDSSPPGIV